MGVARNASWLMAAYAVSLLIPLLELPILTRALGQQAFGQLLFANSLAVLAAVIVEFGFSLTGSRGVVRVRHDPKALARLVADVSAAKLVLFSGAGLVVLAVIALQAGATPIPGAWTALILLNVFSMGFSPVWYYIGVERLGWVIGFEMLLRVAGLAALYALVHSPEDVLTALGIQASVGFLSTSIPFVAMARKTGLVRWRWSGALGQIRHGWHLFLFKGAQSASASIPTLMLGFVAGSQSVGAFAPAEKLVRAATALAMPVLNAMYPNRVATAGGPGGARTAAAAAAAFGLLGLLAAAVAYAWAPELVRVAFGDGYADAALLLSVLVWAIPMRVAFSALSMIWFFAREQEARVARITLASIGLTLAIGLPATWLAGEFALAAVLVGVDAMALAFLVQAMRSARRTP
jgi:polysaccharide transporter, PST family